MNNETYKRITNANVHFDDVEEVQYMYAYVDESHDIDIAKS